MSMGTSLRRYYRGHTLATMSSDLPGQKRHYHFDHQGTTQCLTDQTGAVTDRFAANAWGVQVKRTGTSINRHWYIGAGGYDNNERRLHYVRQRWMNPLVGSWLSSEPLGHLPLYTYGHCRPTVLYDPSGLLARPGTGWRTGQFVYWPGPWEPHSDVNSDWAVWPFDLCLLVLPACMVAINAYLKFAQVGSLLLLEQHVRHYKGGTGQPLTIPSHDMWKLVRLSNEHKQACNAAAKSAAAYLEKVLKTCPTWSWHPVPLVDIWHRGRVHPGRAEVTWKEDVDLWATLGNSQIWAAAKGNCECYPTDRKDRFHMRFTYGITDRNLWDGFSVVDHPMLGDPSNCHKCGWYHDFLVYGQFEKIFNWTRGQTRDLEC